MFRSRLIVEVHQGLGIWGSAVLAVRFFPGLWVPGFVSIILGAASFVLSILTART